MAELEFGAAPAAPSLSFGAEAQVAEAVPEVKEEHSEASNGNVALEAQLTPEELKQVEDFSKQIDIANTTGVMN